MYIAVIADIGKPVFTKEAPTPTSQRRACWGLRHGDTEKRKTDAKIASSRTTEVSVKDFIVYHNPEKMRADVQEVNALSIVTNKMPVDPSGCRIWLMSGRGKPRTFILRSCFIVDSVGPGTADGFKTKLSGKSGVIFDPPIHLDKEHWFQDLKRNQGNFGFGFNRVKEDRFIQALEAMAKLGKVVRGALQSHSGSIDASQRQHVVRLMLIDGTKREAAATGNNAAWLCVCGRKLPLIGRSGRKVLASDAFRVVCPNCARQYHVVPEGKDLGRVLEVRETGVEV